MEENFVIRRLSRRGTKIESSKWRAAASQSERPHKNSAHTARRSRHWWFAWWNLEAGRPFPRQVESCFRWVRWMKK